MAAAALALTACARPVVSPETPTSSPPTTTAPHPQAAFTWTAPPPTETGACPIAQTQPPLPELAGLPASATGLVTYLNAGGSLEALLTALESGAWLPPRQQSLMQGDLNGDGLADLTLSILDPGAGSVTPPGSLYILLCSGQAYQLAYASASDPQAGGPLIRAAHDLTGDGIPDLAFSRAICGAHTCSEQLVVLCWQDGAFLNCLEGKTDDLPTPSFAFEGPTASGTYDISITANGIGSVGAGPFRTFTRTWSWDPSLRAFTVSAETLHPSNFRIHVLNDADDALEVGDFALAHDLYGQVILDDALDDWVAGAEGRANLGAFAMYRQILTYLLRQDQGDAQVVYGILQNSYPAGAPGSAYAQLARTFWEVYESDQELGSACAAAEAFASAHAGQVLEPLTYGYANRVYSAVDMCPGRP